MVEVRVLCWELRAEGSMGGRGRRSYLAVVTSVVPSAWFPKVVECYRVLDSSLV